MHHALTTPLYAACTVFAATLLCAATVSADSIVPITGNTSAGENQSGWMFNRDISTQTPFEFNTEAASIGNGSVYVLPIGTNASDKFIAEYFRNTPIADLESFSYDFQIGPNGDTSKEEHFYLSVYANFGSSDDNKFYDCRYSVLPTSGSNASFTKVIFDPLLPYPVTKRNDSPFNCPSIPVEMDLSSPGSNIRVFAINVGDTSASDQGLDGHIDNVVFATTEDTTVFDFEPYVVVTDKDQCKKNGWKEVTDADGNSFRNQGQCVAYATAKKYEHDALGKSIAKEVKSILSSLGLPLAPGFSGFFNQ